jgi:hypothetical protein
MQHVARRQRIEAAQHAQRIDGSRHRRSVVGRLRADEEDAAGAARGQGRFPHLGVVGVGDQQVARRCRVDGFIARQPEERRQQFALGGREAPQADFAAFALHVQHRVSVRPWRAAPWGCALP